MAGLKGGRRANGSTKRDDLRKIVDMGDVCFDAPEGKVCIDPKSQHMSHTIYLAKVNDDHSISFPKVWQTLSLIGSGKRAAI